MDTAALTEALFLGKLILGLNSLTSLVTGVLAIAAFFRRQPSIDATLTALMKEFNAQLQERVLIRDFNVCENRHAQQMRDLETRFSAAVVGVENRIDQRLSGMHASIVSLRTIFNDSTKETHRILQDLYKDGGWTRGKLDHAG